MPPRPSTSPSSSTSTLYQPELDGYVPQNAYNEERDNFAWLAGYLEQVEQEKGVDFVPRLTMELAGDHAEWYLDPKDHKAGFNVLQQLYRKGIHSFGTHFHTNYDNQDREHVWPDSDQTATRITQDHVTWVDNLIGQLSGKNSPQEIRELNHTIIGHAADDALVRRLGFDLRTGGANEVMNLFL